MRKSLFVLIGILDVFIVLAQSPKGFDVKGSIENMPDTKIMFYYRNPTNLDQIVTDSTDSHNGSFECKGMIADESPVIMVLSKRMQEMKSAPIKFFVQNGDVISVKGNDSEFDLAVSAGSTYNTQLNELNDQLKEDKQSLMRMRRESMSNGSAPQGPTVEMKALMQDLVDKEKAFIKAHPDYLASASTLYLDARVGMEEPEIKEYYNALAPQVQQSMYGKLLQQNFEYTKKYNSGTELAVNFIKKDMNGKIINLADFKGKYVLLDFWGSWCGPCRAGNPHLKDLYAMYKAKGFTIIGIANESGTIAEASAAWKKAVREDGLPWIQVLNNDGKDKFDVTNIYEVSAFPTKILLDKDGKIIGRYTGTSSGAGVADPLEEKLKEVMGG